jgi:rhodanese-related sulfurtransferase
MLGIYCLESHLEKTHMPDSLRITVDEVRKRMEAGEDFALVDTRNPQAWSQSDVKLPEAIRLPLDNLDENLSKIPKDKPVVAYCT